MSTARDSSVPVNRPTVEDDVVAVGDGQPDLVGDATGRRLREADRVNVDAVGDGTNCVECISRHYRTL